MCCGIKDNERKVKGNYSNGYVYDEKKEIIATYANGYVKISSLDKR